MWRGVVEEYREFLPVEPDTEPISLQEGNTPLIYARQLSERTGLEIWLKYEGLNPTGSFKDRGMAMAVTKAKEDGAKVLICASTGNTSASAAAYAARAGMRAVVVIPDGKIAQGKLAQAYMYGAQVVAVRGNFDQALAIVRHLAETHPVTLVNSVNPFRIEGQKTAAFEICDELGEAPDVLAIPVGNAGNITAYWKGFVEYHLHRRTRHRPRMFGFEAEGAAAIVRGKPIAHPETIATAIRIGNPASWNGAVQAVEQSGGMMGAVTDEEILEAYRWVAREGIFCEPASAASVAGLVKARAEGRLEKGLTAVCVLTGNGLKDPDTALLHAPGRAEGPQVVEATEKAVVDAMMGSEALRS
ncbi:threonine synthase [Kyrpidia tusciae]|uniref:Threonine synthase n=1 Tax=Kyrpidia tusciae (strain DSM 2912 / NBRC 15312 / T2) TaxID=562970 RepID=D5WUS6_KYRT2|nr:threonine synthase [Kyrpidia tusciae]ADG05466.1 threonine synthase [Kyrpidia tusciae DSM 2912]